MAGERWTLGADAERRMKAFLRELKRKAVSCASGFL